MWFFLFVCSFFVPLCILLEFQRFEYAVAWCRVCVCIVSMFILLGVCWIQVYSFHIKFRRFDGYYLVKNLTLIFKHMYNWKKYTYVRLLDMPQVTEVLLIFSPFFSPYTSFWMILLPCLQGHRLFSFAVSNLLLILYSKMLDVIFFHLQKFHLGF